VQGSMKDVREVLLTDPNTGKGASIGLGDTDLW
jgi:hypothetical protein